MTDELVIEKKEYPIFEEGLYTAEVTNVESTEGKFGPQTKWWFQLIDVDVEDATLLGWTSATYTDKSKLFKWTRATLGQDFDPVANFRSGGVIGKQVVLNVSRRFDTNGGEFNKIEDLIPLREQKAVIDVGKNEGGPEPPPSWEE